MQDLMNELPGLFAFFELTPDLVCIAGKDGFFKKVNPAVIEKFGYSEQELYAAPISSFIYIEDREITSKRRSALLNGKVLQNFINRYVTKKGDILWLEWTSIYFADKEIVFAIAKDVTERKQAEKEAEEKYNKFKSLATYFKSNIEKDRKYLTYELHEELAQLVFSIKMDVELIAANTPDLPAATKSNLDHALTVSGLLIKTLQRISFSISPNILEEFGLNAALEWLCKEFSILNNIPCSFETCYNEDNLTKEIKIDFFRICQESLSNIITHAKAKEVKIKIKDMDGKIQLTITDNGVGFNIHEKMETPGLISMRERAASINGLLTVQSELGAGTRVCISIAKNTTQ